MIALKILALAVTALWLWWEFESGREVARLFEPKYPRYATAARVMVTAFFVGPLALVFWALFIRT